MGNEIVKASASALGDYLNDHMNKIQRLCDKALDPKRVVLIAINCVSKTPKLQNCTMLSVVRSIYQSLELGLEPGGVYQHAYLVPFGTECTLIPGYKGLIHLAKKNGDVKSIESVPVFAGDVFKCVRGTERQLIHEPAFLTSDPKDLLLGYAIAWLPDGSYEFDVMTHDMIDSIRRMSKMGNDGPWRDSYIEMARKTVVKRLCKYLDLSEQTQRAVNLDNAVESGTQEDYESLATDIINEDFTETGKEIGSVEKLKKKIEPSNVDKTIEIQKSKTGDPVDEFFRTESKTMEAISR